MSKGVYWPPFKCLDGWTASDKYVSKVLDNKYRAQKEYDSAAQLPRNLRSPQFILPIHTCEGPVKGEYMVFSPYARGAVSVKEYLKQSRPNYASLVKALLRLRVDVKRMNDADYRHEDLKMENVMFNETTGRAYLIDFEKLKRSKSGISIKLYKGQYGDTKNLDRIIRQVQERQRR